jgi:hypothetical protein
MAKEHQPKYLNLDPEGVKGYRPPAGQVSRWHVVTDGRRENFRTIAATYGLPVEKIIAFNFPGSVEDDHVVPEIVNWYLHHHREFGCPETHDRINRIFKGGEKIAIPRVASSGPQLPTLPTLDEAKKWFVEKVIPLRTAARGYSANRLWKSPIALVRGGNEEDPNGLCGDVADFVSQEYRRWYNDFRTSDGYILGLVLWEGGLQNHIANVMLLQSKTSKERYTYDSSKQQIKLFAPPKATMTPVRGTGERTGQYNTVTLLALWVFDLYYKMPPHTLGHWWSDRDMSRSGMVTIGFKKDLAE